MIDVKETEGFFLKSNGRPMPRSIMNDVKFKGKQSVLASFSDYCNSL